MHRAITSHRLRRLTTALGILLLAHCASSIRVRTTHPWSAERAAVKRIAVTPFANLSATPQASATVHSAVIHELQRQQVFDVVEPEPAKLNIAGERWSASKLGAEVKADAVLVGTIAAFQYDEKTLRGRKTMAPLIALDVRLVATDTGEVLWAAAVEAKDDLVLSYDSMPIEALAQQVAEQIASTLLDVAGRG